MQAYFGDAWVVRMLIQRGLALVYAVAFFNALNQFRPLLGEQGLLPAPKYLARVEFRSVPSLFHLHYSDRFFTAVAAVGFAVAIAALLGFTDAGPIWVSVAAWLTLWVLYLSIVNIGQIFYGFGWESMLLEAGFFAAFLGPTSSAPSLIPVLALRWMLFRVELGAGLIKWRGDRCWRDLTCLYYHYETQPMPNPLSAHFHHLPRVLHRASVAFSHVVQIILPFGLFLPQPFATVVGCAMIGHQLLLVVSGNYAWLNWLTIVIGFSSLSDGTLTELVPFHVPSFVERPLAWNVVLYALGVVTLFLSVRPVRNLLSRHQGMNESYNPLHLVGSYGAFGSVTKERYEIVVEGTEARELTADARWLEYEFKAKPGDPRRRPPQFAPYHLRLDWMMWFLPFSTMTVQGNGDAVTVFGYERWFTAFVQKLLAADASTLKLLRSDPFEGRQPGHVRASVYRYEMTDRRERRRTGNWWKRSLLGEYMPARGRSGRPSTGTRTAAPPRAEDSPASL